jgi:hypothetical protein
MLWRTRRLGARFLLYWEQNWCVYGIVWWLTCSSCYGGLAARIALIHVQIRLGRKYGLKSFENIMIDMLHVFACENVGIGLSLPLLTFAVQTTVRESDENHRQDIHRDARKMVSILYLSVPVPMEKSSD